LRKRKDKSGSWLYPVPMMEQKQIYQTWTVSELLQTYPEARRVFLEKKTLCIGCYMSRFCNLNDVARVYSLNTEQLLWEIQQAAIRNLNQNSKE
jgi:hybrid cluster-associated redox disulfide protein